MSQPPPWGEQVGHRPPPGQGAYPPPSQGGYPPAAPGSPPPGAYPTQGPAGYPPPAGGYPQGSGSYPPPGPPYGPSPSGPGGFGPQSPGGYGYASGGPPSGGPSQGRPVGLIIGIVAAALVLLVSLGGIVMALTRGGGDQPSSTITPGPRVPPPDSPASADPKPPADDPTTEPAEPPQSTAPPPARPSSPAGRAVSLGQGVTLTPAPGWTVVDTSTGAAQLSKAKSLFVGLVDTVDAGTNPMQLCDSYHRSLAEKATNGKFAKANPIDLGSKRLKGANCQAQVTVTSGQGSSEILLYSVVSVRTDGLAVLGTLYFTDATSTQALSDEFATMVNSMLEGQSG